MLPPLGLGVYALAAVGTRTTGCGRPILPVASTRGLVPFRPPLPGSPSFLPPALTHDWSVRRLGAAFFANVADAPLTFPRQDYKHYYTDQLAFREEISSRKMKYRITAAVLSVLRNSAILDNMAGMLEHMGQAAAALSLDKRFLVRRGRTAEHRHGAAGVKDHLLDG
eukprot:7466542-Pyramimonas_sp.AAC.1